MDPAHDRRPEAQPTTDPAVPKRPVMFRPSKLENARDLAALMLPRPPALNVQRFYDLITDLFDSVTDGTGIYSFGYDARPGELRAAQAELCRQTVATLPRRGRWLDVGCGVGGPACLLAEEHPAVRIHGVNLSRPQVDEARRRAMASGLAARVTFEVDDACRLATVADGSADGVYALETAFHYADISQFVAQAARALKPGGRFACADIVLRPEHIRLADRVLNAVLKKVLASPDMYDVARWKAALARHGFTDVEVRDISREVFGNFGLWADQIEAHRPRLIDRWPGPLLDATIWGMRHLHAQVNDPPLNYVLITAAKPE